MKRKLNEEGVPEEVRSAPSMKSGSKFETLQLDPRLMRGIQAQSWAEPTKVQLEAIPLAMEGKDILARSSTGTGKTAAYLLPVLEKILRSKTTSSQRQTTALILLPTRELAGQVAKVAESLVAFCGQDIRVENLARTEDGLVQRARLADFPDIVVSTPGAISTNLNNGALSPDHLAHLVIDEADLVMSYEYENDLENISKSSPKGVQCFLMSATLSSDLDFLKGLFCRNPVILELDDDEKDTGGVTQYVVRCKEDEKFLLVYTYFMLKTLKGKGIIFVGDIDRSYRLKLFLEQFGIKSAVLNSELPVASRLHIVEQFNKNLYEILIASDENEVLGNEGRKKKSHKENEQEEGVDEDAEKSKTSDPADAPVDDDQDGEKVTTNGKVTEKSGPPKKKRKGPKLDKDAGVSRGLDFRNIAYVLNFDLPTSSKSYTHRIGRTARAGQTGTAISFVVPKEHYRKHRPTTFPSTEHDEEVMAKIIASQEKKGKSIQPLKIDDKRLEPFRYRLADALRAVTRIAVREARVRELRIELLTSDKLKRHFEENPELKQQLRHDGELRAVRSQPHLKHVPDYLLPGGKQAAQDNVGFIGMGKSNENRIRKARMQNKARGKGKRPGGKNADPLKTFNAKGRGKK
ncbi:ATP-dependent RNA helicase-like protein dbp9 [Mytilinidion resinicola]|uniref:RNA helicase n=1 Tax=Mytilinidion resinicola TaxID=574789 RepID=A0A6A6Y4R9_9PEZI|nr:ATP-dependent RNA helicase-like protein dbp9 [Mytilinidion resinicola]KAF2803225.1 ATP-dependent RNA helicase-like protein dbp9 [Mytilinidion resinicola]